MTEDREVRIADYQTGEIEANSRTKSPNEWPGGLRVKQIKPNDVEKYGKF